ncbi:hypothetical protein D3C80_1795070 [compost metagenome]
MCLPGASCSREDKIDAVRSTFLTEAPALTKRKSQGIRRKMCRHRIASGPAGSAIMTGTFFHSPGIDIGMIDAGLSQPLFP